MHQVDRWRTVTPRTTVACVAGNHEWSCTQDALRDQHQAGRLVLLEHGRPWRSGGFTLVGYGCTPATPHWVKDFERLDLPGDPIPQFGGMLWDAAGRCVREADLQRHFGGGPSMADELAEVPPLRPPWILVAHAPPYDTKLDRLPKVAYPIGSRAVRQFIEQRQPLCGLHGHVHDSPLVTGSFLDSLGSTPCINPGQNHDRLYAVLLDAERPAETARHTVL
jgi:hypothetical protein